MSFSNKVSPGSKGEAVLTIEELSVKPALVPKKSGNINLPVLSAIFDYKYYKLIVLILVKNSIEDDLFSSIAFANKILPKNLS